MPRLVRKRRGAREPEFLAHTHRVAAAAADHKALDLKAYDVRDLTLIADCFVVCSAASEPQMKAIYQSVRRQMKEVGVEPLHAEGVPSDSWLVLDFGAVIFHVFRMEAREFYDLDGLWGDAPLIDLEFLEE